MRPLLMSVAAILVLSTKVDAQELLDPAQIVNDPQSVIGKRIKVSATGCIDDPKSGYLCTKAVGGQILKIHAAALGSNTEEKLAQRLLGDCMGTANIRRPICKVDAVIQPSAGSRGVQDTPNGSLPVTTVEAPELELYAIKTVKRSPTRQSTKP